MQNIVAICFMAVMVGVQCLPPRNTSSNDVDPQLKDVFEQHIKIVKNFDCRKPRPVAIPTRDLNPSLGLFPVMTLAMRCGAHSGCCTGSGQPSCLPVPGSIEKVSKVFYLMSAIGDEKKGYVKIDIENHTKCKCQQMLTTSTTSTTENPVKSS